MKKYIIVSYLVSEKRRDGWSFISAKSASRERNMRNMKIVKHEHSSSFASNNIRRYTCIFSLISLYFDHDHDHEDENEGVNSFVVAHARWACVSRKKPDQGASTIGNGISVVQEI